MNEGDGPASDAGPFPDVSLRRSIATRLLAVVFGIYLGVAVAVTALQIADTFVRTKRDLIEHLRIYGVSFSGGLSSALWRMDEQDAQTIVAGMLEIRRIAGVRVTDHTRRRLMGVAGLVADETGRTAAFDRRGSHIAVPHLRDVTGVFFHEMPIIYHHEVGDDLVGYATLFSHAGAVIKEIQEPVLFLVAGAVVKTAALWVIFLVVSRRLLVRPLGRLVEEMERFDPNRPATSGLSLGAGRNDELARIGNAFEVMNANIRDANRALRDHRQHLEAEVEARTRDLSAAKDAAEQANMAKSRFLAAASHDLRQPLHALRLFASTLEEDFAGSADGRARRTLSNIVASVENLGGLLDSLLDVSKLDAGVVIPEVTVFAIQEILGTMALEFAADADDKGIGLRVEPSSILVRSDPVLLGNIIRNLISNAVRYTNRGGVLAGCRRLGEEVRIEVWDTGIGIPENRIGEVFKEFLQLDNPARQRGQGLGLGLAIVERTARLLGHRITVRSMEGRGSMFAVTVPRASVHGLRPPTAPADAPRSAPGQWAPVILVIDDDEFVLMATTLLLEDWGYRVAAVGDVGEALQWCARNGPPNAMVVDFRLPGPLDGGATIDHIRQTLGREVPAVIVTGDTGTNSLREIQAGGYILLHKPVNPEHLRGILAELVA